MEYSASDMEAEAEYYAEKKAHRCRCFGDMPGGCPGPSNCPLQSEEAPL